MEPKKSNPSDKPETPINSRSVEHTAGSNSPGSENEDHELENYTEEQSNLQQRREERGSLRNSEGSGQQYSNTEKDIPPGQDEPDTITSRNTKNQLSKDHTSDTTEEGE